MRDLERSRRVPRLAALLPALILAMAACNLTGKHDACEQQSDCRESNVCNLATKLCELPAPHDARPPIAPELVSLQVDSFFPRHLSPEFAPLRHSYSLGVSLASERVTVKARALDPAATISIGATEVGAEGASVALALGETEVFVDVETPSGGTSRYAVTILRGREIHEQVGFLKASNTGAGDAFGYSVALHGDTLAVGAILEDSSATGVGTSSQETDDNTRKEAGAVYIFRRSNHVWRQEAYLKASNSGFEDQFGNSVSLHGDRLAVGAYVEDNSASGVNPPGQLDNSLQNSGAVYVFRRTGAEWVQEAYFKSPRPDTSDHFGVNVAISADTLVVGADLEDSDHGLGLEDNSVQDSGAAYVYRDTAGTWAFEAYLKASNADEDDLFGFALALSGDTLVVGAYREDSNGQGVDGPQDENSSESSGAAYVFQRKGTSWAQEAYLKASNTDGGDNFGHRVSISGDTIVVGANAESSSAAGVNGDESVNDSAGAGAAYVFQRAGGQWQQEAYLKASQTSNGDQFGHSVAIDDDRIAVGAIGADLGKPQSGAVYLFERSEGTWSPAGEVTAFTPGAGFELGFSVAVSGTTIASGAPWQSGNAVGAAGSDTYDCTGQDCDGCFASNTCETCVLSDECAYASGAVYVFE